MAGEMETAINYNDIDANKMLNKAGLLELSGQIKGYIQANAGGGASYTAGDGIDITNDVISNTIAPKIISINGNSLYALKASGGGLTAANEAYLSNLYQYGYEAYPCKILWSRTNQGIVDIPFYFLRVDTTWRKLYFWGVITPGNDETRAIELLVFSFNSNNAITNFTPPDNGTQQVPGPNGVRLSAYYSPSGQATGVGNAFQYIKNNYATKAELPPIPTDPSADGTYVLQNTVSSGTATYSWGTPSGGGGGTTYTAGTGISIENGVISINLANAEEEEF